LSRPTNGFSGASRFVFWNESTNDHTIGISPNVTIRSIAGPWRKATASVSFARPGTYVLRGYADDGIYVTPVDVTIAVR
jgi:hypothetical protein